MKNRKTALICLLMSLLLIAVPALAEGTLFEDSVTGVTLEIPEGWTEKSRNEENGMVMVVYSLDADPDIEMMTGSFLFGNITRLSVPEQLPDHSFSASSAASFTAAASWLVQVGQRVASIPISVQQ